MEKYFRVKIGYGKTEFISISEDQLEKALFAFETNNKVILNGIPVRGQDIITITPDYHKALGYGNTEHEFDQTDWAELAKSGFKKPLLEAQALASRRVDYLIENRQEHLIGKNVPIPALESRESKLLIEGSKRLANGMRMTE